jgi:glycosyltransferase involved in cell wall biosynthesis
MDALGGGAMTSVRSPERWCIITCEYPPLSGGVSDHTYLLARALTESGDVVDIWTAPGESPPPDMPGVTVHVLPSLFGFDALRMLRRVLRDLPAETRVLVQYVPTGYGWRMMNVGFALLLYSQRARGLEIYFHEVGFRIRDETRLRRKFAGVVHLVMNWLAVRAATRVFVAIPEWERRIGVGSRRPAEWIPVPSNVPDVADPARVDEIRRELLLRGKTIVGHFGTFGRFHTAVLQPTLTRILDDDPQRAALLIGRKGAAMRAALIEKRADLASRIIATGGLEAGEVSAHIAACDILLQPYDDGASARRGSLMAGLALGTPMVSNLGVATGDAWKQRGVVRLTGSARPEVLARAVDELLSDAMARDVARSAGRQLYHELFAMERTVERLRGAVVPLPPAAQPRVLMLHTTLPSPGRKPGGVEVAVHRLANALVDLDVHVTVASLTDAPADARYIHRRLFRHLPWLRESRIGRLVVLPALLNGIFFDDADVVHFHGDDWFVVRRPHATVRTLHGSALREAQRATRWQRRVVQYIVFPFERLAARMATVAVAVGRDAADLHGVTRVVGNGVDPTFFRPGTKSTTPVVLYVGTWEGRKRGQWMYEMFVTHIAPRHPTAALRFIADEAPPPHPRVTFEQFPDDATLARAYREAWVFALPSTYEGFGIPYLEAMSSGTAVLATPNTGARELLGDGAFGMLADDDTFGDALLHLLADDDRRHELAHAGLLRSRDYVWPTIASAYVDVYREAILRHDRHSPMNVPTGGVA